MNSSIQPKRDCNNNREEYNKALLNRQGIFGLGFSYNNNLDLMNLTILAYSGIVIKLFFQENYTKLGNIGPASTIIWGYGLTALALFLMMFMSLYLSKETYLENKKGMFGFFSSLLFNSTLPIAITFGVVIYTIVINYIYYKRINSNKVSTSYHTYSLFGSFVLILQIALILRYLFNNLNLKNTNSIDNKVIEQSYIIKSITYILGLINFIFVLIKHIILAFFSTDG